MIKKFAFFVITLILSSLPIVSLKMREIDKDEIIAGQKSSISENVVIINKLNEEIVACTGKIDSYSEENTEIKKIKDDIASKNSELESELKYLKETSAKIYYLGNFKITFYCGENYAHICGSGNGVTSSGAKAAPGHTIAVDPDVIPMGSTVYIEGMGEYVAEDVGGLIKGNKIDIYVNTHSEAEELGTFYTDVWFVRPE